MNIKNGLRRFTGSVLLLSCMTLMSISCVNEEYDLDKELDMNVSVLTDISLPVGSFRKVMIADLLKMTEESSILTSDQNGNLSISLTDDRNILEQSVTVPDFTFEDSYRGKRVEQYLGDFYFTYDDSYADLINLDYISTPRKFPDIPVEIEFEKVDVPEQIKDIRYAEVNALAHLNLYIRINREIPFKGYAAAGTEIIFPDWVVLGEVSGNLEKDGQIVRLVNDMEITVTTPSQSEVASVVSVPIIGVDATKLPEGQGITSDHKFIMLDDMTIRGSSFFTFDGSVDVTGEVVSPVITSIVSFSNLDIISVDVKLGDNVEKDLVSGIPPVELSGIPEIFQGPDITLDLNDIRLDVEFLNSSPFSGSISTSVRTSAADREISQKEIGPVHFDCGSPLSPSEMRWSFSGGFLQAPEGYEHHIVDNISDLVMNIPDKIEFTGFDLALDDEFFTVRPGERYDLSQSFSIHAPLSFGKDFLLPYSHEITDLGIEFKDFRLTTALLYMDVENTIPVTFNADAYAIDENGEVIEGVTLKIKDNAAVKAGSLESPTVSEIVFELKNSRESIVLDGLVINFKASADGDDRFSDIPLNENQSLHFKNIVLNLPEGVSADINELN